MAPWGRCPIDWRLSALCQSAAGRDTLGRSARSWPRVMRRVIQQRTAGMGPLSGLLLLLIVAPFVRSEQQMFRVRPVNTTVVEGSTIVLPCEIDHQAGRMQWAKDGFALGYTRSLPGYPRYRMLGGSVSGVHHLEIRNASLQDDGRFQCQVSPNRGQQAIKADAYITVLLKPMSVVVKPRKHLVAPSGAVEVRAGHQLTLECHVTQAKPAAAIIWRKNDVQITSDVQSDIQYPSSVKGRLDTTSAVLLSPTVKDNGASISCLADHPAVSLGTRQATVLLSVLYPPGAPEISGYTEDQTLNAGDNVTLVCTSRGGNPLGDVVWLKNGVSVTSVTELTPTSAAAVHQLTADATDFNAIYRCEVKSSVQPRPAHATVQLKVNFGPELVHLSGPQETVVGHSIHALCVTTESNPPSKISWTIDEQPVSGMSELVKLSEHVGWLASSNMSAVVPQDAPRKLRIACTARNTALNRNRTRHLSVNVLRPPDAPQIVPDFSRPLQDGSTVALNCDSLGGNPPAAVSWLVGGIDQPGQPRGPGRSQLAYKVTAADNGVTVTCRSRNRVTDGFLIDTYRLTVFFGPDELRVSSTPGRLEAGGHAELTCESSASLPAAELSWWKDGEKVIGVDRSSEIFSSQVHGGYVVRHTVVYRVDWKDNGASFQCRSLVPAIGVRGSADIVLSVQHAPVFDGIATEHRVRLGGQLVVNVTALANPAQVNYSWSGDGPGQVVPPGGDVILHLTSARRSDGGWYHVEAVNVIGVTSTRILVDVLYPPEAVKQKSALVAAGEDAILECRGRGNPPPNGTVLWRRDGYNLTSSRIEVTSHVTDAEVTSRLTVRRAGHSDVGVFTCVISNGIGPDLKQHLHLLIARPPLIDRTPAHGKYAAAKDEEAVVRCRASGAPAVAFNWSKNGQPLRADDAKNTGKYITSVRQLDLTTWQSTLRVRDVTTSDLGRYDCAATNRQGGDSHWVRLVRPGPPDPPSQLRSLNITAHTVTLAWTAGFDGGYPQEFRVMHATATSTSSSASSAAVVGRTDSGRRSKESQIGPRTLTVTHLTADTAYRFWVQAHNRLGNSGPTDEHINARTSEASPPVGYVTNRGGSSGLSVIEGSTFPRHMIIVVTATGGVLLLINVSLISCFIRRRQLRKASASATPADSQKADRESRPDSLSADLSMEHCRHSRSGTPVQANLGHTHWAGDIPSPLFEFRGHTSSFHPRRLSSPTAPRRPRFMVPPVGDIFASDSTVTCGSSKHINTSTPFLQRAPSPDLDLQPQVTWCPPRAYQTLPNRHANKLYLPPSLVNLRQITPPLAFDLGCKSHGDLV